MKMDDGKKVDGNPVLVGSDSGKAISNGPDTSLAHVPLLPDGKGEFNEEWLQGIIHRHPECLPISEIEPGFGQLTAICTEMHTARGNVDNLLLSGKGDIVLVETKLFRNPEARRQVVGQALDYATCLFDGGYEAFEKAALSTVRLKPKPGKLYDLLPEGPERLDEAAFVDAVSSNLRRGRVLIIIAGDGIRTEAQALLEGMKTHARFGFTLALVEMPVFRAPGDEKNFIVWPRVLAKTAILNRVHVVVSGNGATITEQQLFVPETVSTQQYWDALESKLPGARSAIEKLIAAAEPLGVYPELLGTLNLKWQRPGGKPVNLGYIYKHRAIWTDAAGWFAPRELAEKYVREVAALFDRSEIASTPSHYLTLYRDGKPLRLEENELDRLVEWVGPMGRFIDSIKDYDARAVDPAS